MFVALPPARPHLLRASGGGEDSGVRALLLNRDVFVTSDTWFSGTALTG